MNDDEILSKFREAARVTTSPFITARAQRDLDAAIDRETRSHARWTAPRLAIVALSGAFAGAVAVAVVMWPSSGFGPASTTTTAALVTTPVPVLSSSTTPAPILAPIVAAEPVKVAAVPLKAKRVKSWREDSQAKVAAGDGVGAAHILVRALATDDAAAASLALLARQFPDAIEAVDDELAADKGAEAMRIRCEQKLLHVRDKTAVDACRAFALDHPQTTGARTLAFAAGRLAEDDLGDLAAAEELYSRALQLSPFAGLVGTDALLARARVRTELGNADEARADLRLYLANEPVGRNDSAVAALASRLGL